METAVHLKDTSLLQQPPHLSSSSSKTAPCCIKKTLPTAEPTHPHQGTLHHYL